MDIGELLEWGQLEQSFSSLAVETFVWLPHPGTAENQGVTSVAGEAVDEREEDLRQVDQANYPGAMVQQ